MKKQNKYKISLNNLQINNEARCAVIQCVEKRSDMMIEHGMCVGACDCGISGLCASVRGVGIFTALFQSLMNNSALQKALSTEAS